MVIEKERSHRSGKKVISEVERHKERQLKMLKEFNLSLPVTIFDGCDTIARVDQRKNYLLDMHLNNWK